jgi:hypothetical protein
LFINAPYFSKLSTSQLYALSAIHLGGLTLGAWDELVLELYARGKLQDMDHAQHLLEIFLAWSGTPWIPMHEYAKDNDESLYEAMLADARVVAALAAVRELLHRERNSGQPRAPPPAPAVDADERRRLNLAYFSVLGQAQLQTIALAQWGQRNCSMSWHGIVDQLYAQGKIKDATRAHDLLEILLPLHLYDTEWLHLAEHARLYDEPVADALDENPVIYAAIGLATEARFQKSGYGCFPEFQMEKK